MSTLLDLSKYPHIDPETIQEVELRSNSIEKIRDLAENLFKAMESFLQDAVQFDNKVRLLDEREQSLIDRDTEISTKEKDVYTREEKVETEREYIVNANVSIKQRELVIESNKRLLEEIEKGKKEWEEKKAEVILKEKDVDSKLSKLMTVNKKLEQDEAVVNKQSEINAESKRLLDIREARIREREIRLQMDAEE